MGYRQHAAEVGDGRVGSDSRDGVLGRLVPVRMRCVLGSLLCALCTCAAAQASVTPPAAQAEAKVYLGAISALDLELAPTRLPAHYAYESFSVSTDPAAFDLSFADQRFISNANLARAHQISFDVMYARDTRACTEGARKTMRVAGATVYVESATVWRCVRSVRGNVLKESAHGSISVVALARLVASTRPN